MILQGPKYIDMYWRTINRDLSKVRSWRRGKFVSEGTWNPKKHRVCEWYVWLYFWCFKVYQQLYTMQNASELAQWHRLMSPNFPDELISGSSTSSSNDLNMIRKDLIFTKLFGGSNPCEKYYAVRMIFPVYEKIIQIHVPKHQPDTHY